MKFQYSMLLKAVREFSHLELNIFVQSFFEFMPKKCIESWEFTLKVKSIKISTFQQYVFFLLKYDEQLHISA